MGLVPESAAPAAASLAPGFRFHPTDEELVRYYLKRKICGKSFRFDAISEIDIYKCEPWDLPGMSRLKSRDLEWYFFSVLDKKYGNGSKTNRATERGYWKTTGKDRPVLHYSRTVGMKKTLVYHSGRAPRGERSNYVMHEYRLIDEALEKAGLPLEAFVLCRVFQKSGSGPKNGEQYGAPLIEDEWEDDEVVMVHGEGPFEELADGDDACLDGNDLEQILDADIPSVDVPLPKSFYYEDDNSYVQDGLDLVSDDQHVEEPVESVDDDQNHFVDLGQTNCDPEHPDAHKLFEFPVETDEDKKPVRHEYIGVPNNTMNDVEEDYLLDEPYMDTSNNIPLDDGLFLETNDLSNPIKVDPSSFDTLEEYLTYFDALDDNTSQYIAFDPSNMIGSENCVSDAVSVSQMCVNGGAPQGTTENQHLVQDRDNDVASTSKQKPENFGSDIPDSFIKQSSCKLGSIPAAPAFASEFASKDAALGLHSAYHPSSAIHVTAGMIEIRNMTLSGNGTFWSAGKNADVTIILSFDLPYNTSSSARLEPMDGVVLGKAGSATSHGWLYLISLWVLILSASFKIGNYIYTGNAL